MADDVSVEVADAIAELTKQAQEDPSLAGDTQDLLRKSQTLTKKSMVRAGNVALPDRVKFYRSSNGWESWLPTAQLAYHLGKRHPDGTPVFVKENPHGPLVYVEDQCDVCKPQRRGEPKRFTHRIDYVTHMENKHPREYRMLLEDQKTAKGPQEMAAALMSMAPNERAAFKALLGGEENGTENTIEATSEARCDACGWTKQSGNVAASLRGHRIRCKGAEGVASGSGADQAPSAVR